MPDLKTTMDQVNFLIKNKVQIHLDKYDEENNQFDKEIGNLKDECQNLENHFSSLMGLDYQVIASTINYLLIKNRFEKIMRRAKNCTKKFEQ